MERIKAKDGYVFKKKDGSLLSSILCLGSNDSLDNYIEIKKPKRYIIIKRYSEEYEPLYIDEEKEISENLKIEIDEKITLFDDEKNLVLPILLDEESIGFHVDGKDAICDKAGFYSFSYDEKTNLLKVGKAKWEE